MSNRPQRVEEALIRSGCVSSVWKVQEDGDVVTALCRANGGTVPEKERAMEELAKALLPDAGGRIFVAKQFMCKGEKFGFTWNISLFGEEAVQHLEGISSRPRRAEVGARVSAPTSAPDRKKTQQKLVYNRGRMKIWEFPLPHVQRGRNVASSDPSSPLGYGKGATPVKAPDEGYLM